MDPLPLLLISWVFTVAGMAALLLGASLLTLMHKADKLPGRNNDYTVWNDIILLGVWGMSFIAGMGMLSFKPWAPKLLEYFCWVLIVLTIVNAMTRAQIMKDKFAREKPPREIPWVPVAIGSALVVIPVVWFCAATIWTLHDEGVKEDFSNQAKAAALPR